MKPPIFTSAMLGLFLTLTATVYTPQAYAIGKSLLADQLNQLRSSEKDCNVSELDLARAFPQFANGPKKSYKDKDNKTVWANSLEPWFEKTFKSKSKVACQNVKEISNAIDSVHQKAISECAERGKEAVPKWVLGFWAASGSQIDRSEGVGLSSGRLQLNYQKNDKGVFVREGVTKSLAKNYEATLLAIETARIADAINGAAHGTGLAVSALGTGLGLGQPGLKPEQIQAIEATVKERINKELDIAGIPANIGCKTGWCESGGKHYRDKSFTGKRPDWKTTDAGELGIAEPKEDISTIELIRTQCQGPNGERKCSPADDDLALDPLKECVDKEVKAIYDQRGAENFGPDHGLNQESLSPVDLRKLGLCDSTLEGKDLCAAKKQDGCDVKKEGTAAILPHKGNTEPNLVNPQNQCCQRFCEAKARDL